MISDDHNVSHELRKKGPIRYGLPLHAITYANCKPVSQISIVRAFIYMAEFNIQLYETLQQG